MAAPMPPRRPIWSANNVVGAGARLLAAAVAFFVIASQRELLIAGVVVCLIALGVWDILWWRRRRER